VTDHDLLVTSGVGPIEARRFVFQLARHLEQLAESRGLAVCDVTSHGDDDAPRSMRLRVRGDAPGRLADQCGTHELVHRAAERGRAARKRWFAAVSLHPSAIVDGPLGGVELRRDELVVTACRAGGPGGQHVNKVATAVRVQHVPSGLVVRSAASRSQRANLEEAIARLASLLAAQAQAARADATARRRTAHYQVVRGAAMRAYRLDGAGRLVVTR